MRKIIFAITAFAITPFLWAQQATAQLVDLPLPKGAEITATQTNQMASYPLALGPFQNGAVPMERRDAPLAQMAYRMALGAGLTTHDMIGALRAHLVQLGFDLPFECHSDACGGFDFRYALELLPEPEMHVDLGDYRYLLAEKGVGPARHTVAVLVSKSPKYGFAYIAQLGPNIIAAPKVAQSTKSPPPPSPFEIGQAKVLAGVIFASGKADLENLAPKALTDLAAWLQANPSATATLIGHTDNTGKASANSALSLARAERLRDVLIAQHGIDGGRINAMGQGGDQPIAPNDTAEGRAQNRRVEVVISAEAGQ